ncbi:MAG: YidC/Oxa1 family insertase periplasmic-domain containing protein [Sedimentisphaerales bacterium]|nr:YidC/Oxa1 family insertase periplasmic-domain containing protein [Sedimentisphaerales bacterium]
MKRVLIVTIIGFCLFCGLLVVESGLFDASIRRCGPCVLLQSTTGEEQVQADDANEAPVEKEQPAKLGAPPGFRADDAEPAIVILGAEDPNSEDPETGYKFRLELSSKGAAMQKATFTNGNGNGFDDRDPKNPKPLVVFSPVRTQNAGEIMAMANTSFVLADYGEKGLALPLDRLLWKSAGAEKGEDGSQLASFEAIIKVEGTGEPVIRLVKTYEVRPGSFMVDCNIVVENLSEKEEKVYFNMHGPGGFAREEFRTDMRRILAAFEDSKGEISSLKLDGGKLRKAANIEARRLKKPGGELLWVAAVNKYFAAILVPQPDGSRSYCDWVTDRIASFQDPDGQNDTGDENLTSDLTVEAQTLAAKGQADSSKAFRFGLYIGPKDKSLFDKNAMYKKLRFSETIDFMGCCCPASIIKPLAFGILAIMKWMHGFWPHNYGIVIIVLVFLVRLILHPITKKSQVSMSKMQKLGPMAEEIKKKYAGNKAEMNKQMMTLYREHGASPIMGFLPMMLQMPIWIALWSAVYASIDLRGARFLPVWITDLSMPDAFVSFQTITVPLLRWKIQSLNLLPIMMGLAFYLQQKLMPSQAGASANPQVAQQQKMMMIMMPLLFPLMLYNGPSGVNLYIMSSTFAGVLEQYVIRKHIREKEEAESQGLVATTKKTGGKVKKKKPKPFFKT